MNNMLMQLRYIACALALAFAACNNGGTKTAEGSATTDERPLQPAEPAGTMQVTILNRNEDTSSVKFNFTIDTIRYERTYKDLPLVKGFPDSAIYRVFWNEPNSVWIGFIKPNRDTRYYHASQDGRLLKVLWVPSPPKKIYEYMEKELGLGDVIRQQPRLSRYDKNIQSGQIIGDFIVALKPGPDKGTMNVFMEFGGIQRTLEMTVPEGGKPYIQAYGDDHVIAGVELNGELEEYYEIKVVNGRIGYKQLQTVINN